MKKMLWFSVFFLSTSWLYFIPIFNLPVYTIGFSFVIIGLVFACLNRPFKNYITSLTLCGVILTVQAFFLPLYTIIVSHNHRLDFLSGLVSNTGNLLGLKTAVNSGIVYVQTIEKNYAFTTTFEKLGFYPWFNILLASLILFILMPNVKNAAKKFLIFLVISFVYVILRYVILIAIFTLNEDFNIFWDPLYIIISFVPLVFLLVRFIPLRDVSFDLDFLKNFKINKNKIISISLIFLFVFSLVGAFVFQDPGTEKNGRILIDELHSSWENTTEIMDTEWYGQLSTYNYYNWAEWLDKYYDIDRNTDEYLTLDLLENYDILILKCPTNSYSAEEVRSIISFVDSGGGLYLIGDHTNVFGMNYYLNLVSENFGITFKNDANYELGTGSVSTYKPGLFFPHTIIQNMEEFNFLTSCSLTAPITSENVIIGNRVSVEPGSYATQNFFRKAYNLPDCEYGLILQVVAHKYGKGRIVAFTDSTCFSNYCFFADGYTEFNLGAMEYLNRENSLAYLNFFFFLISIISILAYVYVERKNSKNQIITILIIVGLISFSVATPIFSYVNQINYPLPSAHSDYPKVCFDMSHNDIIINPFSSVSGKNLETNYATFFCWTQRVGLYPSIQEKLDDACLDSDAIVIINPNVDFTIERINLLKSFVNEGGKILVLDSIDNEKSTTIPLVSSYDSEFNIIKNGSGDNISLSFNVADDNTIITKNTTTICTISYGDGLVVVAADSNIFSDSLMGNPFTEPDEEQREIYDIEFYIFEDLIFN